MVTGNVHQIGETEIRHDATGRDDQEGSIPE